MESSVTTFTVLYCTSPILLMLKILLFFYRNPVPIKHACTLYFNRQIPVQFMKECNITIMYG
jgi:hypothetical protein